jgi:hypothetical protein
MSKIESLRDKTNMVYSVTAANILSPLVGSGYCTHNHSVEIQPMTCKQHIAFSDISKKLGEDNTLLPLHEALI